MGSGVESCGWGQECGAGRGARVRGRRRIATGASRRQSSGYERACYEQDRSSRSITRFLLLLTITYYYLLGPLFEKYNAILYTLYLRVGPLFEKYNAILRSRGDERNEWAAARFTALCAGNKYTTTLFVLNSAIVKLAKLTVADKVYRGLSGRALPRCFRRQDADGCVGGVSFAFLSTTRDEQVMVVVLVVVVVAVVAVVVVVAAAA